MAIPRIISSDPALLLYSSGNQTCTISSGASVTFNAPGGNILTITATSSLGGSVAVASTLTVASGTATSAYANGQKLILVGTAAQTIMQFAGAGSGANVKISSPDGTGFASVGSGKVDMSALSVQANKFIVNSSGTPTALNGVATVALGVESLYANALTATITTASQTLMTYSPTSTLAQQYSIKWAMSAVSTATPTLSATWTDPKAGAQNQSLFTNPMNASTQQQGIYTVVATNAAPINVIASASVASAIFLTGTIAEAQ